MQHHSDCCYGPEKAATRQQRGSVQDHLTRHLNVDAPFSVARHREGKQGGHESRRNRSPETKPWINSAAGDERVREQEQLKGEETTQSETQWPDVPVLMAFGI